MAKKQKPKSRKDRLRRQYAALPYRLEGDETEVMLVTSRETHRWILPKGWPEKKLTGPQVAAKEAMEEAGLIGEPADRPVGSYSYHKRLNNGRDVPCGVDVFPLRVERLLDDWPERQQRERRWFTLPQAAMAVEEGELVTLLLRLAAPVA
jgi:8-oxo-dGTP pyrophosphatase MutT (NUDIX family)